MGSSSKSQTVGYRYYAGMHQVYAMSPADFPVQEVTRIRVGEAVVWSGSATGNGTININAPDAFGGEKKEGGVVGAVDALFGGAAQGVNAYLNGRLGTYQVPAFRGVFSLVLRRVYLAALNPYIKPWAVYARRNVSPWYSAKSAIGEDMNPAHQIRHLLTDPHYGLGAANIDDASFTAAADALHAEGMGLSVRWQSGSQSIEDLIGSIAEVADASVYEDQASGKWRIKLARKDYDVETLPILDNGNVARVERFAQQQPGDLTSEVVLTYTDRDTGKQGSVTVQDLAVLAMQYGNPVRVTLDLPHIPTGALASKIAARELLQRATPLARATLIVNRAVWNFNIGDVFRWRWPEYGIDELIMRVAAVGRGRLTDGRIRVECVQDIFSVAAAVYAPPPPSAWVTPNTSPSAAADRVLIEAPYWILVRDVVGEWPSLWADLDPLSGLVMAAVGRESGDTYDYRLYTGTHGSTLDVRAAGAQCPYTALSSAIVPSDTELPIGYIEDEDLVEVGDTSLVILGSELLRVVSFGGGTVTVERGVLDTVPTSHASGTKMFFVGGSGGKLSGYAIDPTEWVSGQLVDAKILPRTSLGALDYASAPTDTVTMAARFIRPYPPGNVKVNAIAWPGSVSGNLTITWAHRDRLSQTAYLVDQTQGDIGPEVGTEYTVRIYNAQTGGTLIRTYTGIIGTSQEYTTAQAATDNGGTKPANLRVEIESVRDGYTSWQRQVRAFAWA